MHDCLPCHFEYEERELRPYLPADVFAWLRAEHIRLRADGYPRAAVAAHAAEEMRRVGDYAPPHVLAGMARDHAAHARGEIS